MIEPVASAPQRPSRQSLADSIYEILLDRLIEGAIQASSVINIDLLARDFGVSPTPIREALARLEATGLVERVALRGYRAAPLFTRDQLVQLMDARLVIEAPGARLASMNADDPFIRSLRTNVEDMKRLVSTDDRSTYGSYRKIDEQFHDLIAQRADNPFLFRAYKSLEAHVQRFRLFGAIGTSDVRHAVTEHIAIVDAIASGDSERSYAVMSQHIEAARARAVHDREVASDQRVSP